MESTKLPEFDPPESSSDGKEADAPPLSSYRILTASPQISAGGGTLPKNIRQLPARREPTLNDTRIIKNKKSTRRPPSVTAESSSDVPFAVDIPTADAAPSSSHRKTSTTTQKAKDQAVPQLPATGQPTKKIETNTETTVGTSKNPLSLAAEEKAKKIGAALLHSEQHLARVADEKAKQITHATTKQIGTALKQSEEAYEKSRWCFFARFIGQFPKYFPRVFSFTFGVLVPLWMLILISAGFGIMLAEFEATEEKIENHDILASRARASRISVETTDIGSLPVDCYSEYLSQSNRSLFEERIKMYISASSNSADNIFPPIINYTFGDLAMETEQDILLYMAQCQKEKTGEIQDYLQLRDGRDLATEDSLTFNWIRCWPKEINEVWADTTFTFFPTPELIEASRPSNQEATVQSEFSRILDETEKDCLDSGGEENECFEEALEEAADRSGEICHENIEGTSWFFFSIMTTIGYGNQVPVTDEGRRIIYSGGIACLILYAAVLGSAGYIILAIFDDFVSRFWLSHFLKYPLVGVVLWGGIWIGWAYAIAVGADIWWAERLPDFQVDRDDSLWFAFVSTSTIGLGDYFLQPEVMFASDALSFSAVFLIGFVFLSTFLKKIGGFLFSVMPKRGQSLETRLKDTNIFIWKHWPCIDHIKSDYIRSIAYVDKYNNSDDNTDEMMDQVEWMEVLKARYTDQSLSPPLDDVDEGGEKSWDEMLEEEEMILNALLESVEHRRLHHLKRAKASTTSPSSWEPSVSPSDFRLHSRDHSNRSLQSR